VLYYLPPMGKKILIVDDDPDVLELLAYNLEREGFEIHTVHDSLDAVGACEYFLPDLIILDIMMPGLNGIEVCKQLRSRHAFRDTFIFFLTAKSERYYQEAALDTGGDDFIEKIVGIRSLTNKIKWVLRRRWVIRKRQVEIHCGKLRINRRAGIARIGKKDITLSRPEIELLFFFAQNPGKVISAQNLQMTLSGADSLPSDASIEMYLQLLMRKLDGHWLFKVAEGNYTFRTD